MLKQNNPESSSMRYADLVLEGGGVRGIAHVGALAVAEARGYRWQRCAGTSAGALVAALLAVGYTAAEIHVILTHAHFARFARDAGLRGWASTQVARLFLKGGLHTGDSLETFVRALVRARGKATFGDLVCAGQERAPLTSPFRYRLVVVASDITNGRMLRLPQDLVAYGQHPDELDIALAVRMSASIPFFYQPIVRHDSSGRLYRVVDGGLLSNFPVGIFDVEGTPIYPTFGLRLVDTLSATGGMPSTQTGQSLIRFGQDLLNTMLTAHDRLYLDDHTYVRTIAIPVNGINGMKFDLSTAEINQLYANGEAAAERFFATWDFSAYKAAYRSGRPPLSRRELLNRAMHQVD